MTLFRLSTTRWHILRINFFAAGLLVLLAIGLTVASDNLAWLILAGFVGVMQIIFAITGYCPSSIILDKLGIPRN